MEGGRYNIITAYIRVNGEKGLFLVIRAIYRGPGSRWFLEHQKGCSCATAKGKACIGLKTSDTYIGIGKQTSPAILEITSVMPLVELGHVAFSADAEMIAEVQVNGATYAQWRAFGLISYCIDVA